VIGRKSTDLAAGAKDQFILMMWLYWPKEKPPSILDGSWKIPQVKEVS